MSDKIELRIGNFVYSRFKSYSVDSDLYEAADQFNFELFVDNNFIPAAGMKCEFYVNKKLELTGVIDSRAKGYNSKGRYIKITGRDVMGFIVDSYVEKFETIQNTSLIDIAERLLKNVPYIKSIEYDTGADKRDAAKPYIQTEPGQRIFDVLKDVAASRGLLFYGRANGELVFRKPAGRGRTLFTILRKNGYLNESIIQGEDVEDITNRHSKYTVLTQEQGGSEDDPAQINNSATVEDAQFPFRSVLYKPYVEAVSDDKGSCKKLANMRMEHARVQSKTTKYNVKGHSQNINNWAIDELIRVDDDELGIHAEKLIYKRTFSGDGGGQYTDLTIGLPGLLA